jgi:alpha-tubulin suppressor-like RCC1 family protein
LNLVTLALGGAYTCGLNAAGAASCWGANIQGQFGNDKAVVDGVCTLHPASQPPNRIHPYCWSPVPAASGFTFESLAAGAFHACGLTLEGRVLCRGDNDWGQIGDRTTTPQLTPVPIALDLLYADLSGGPSYACARTSVGQAYCWGALPWDRLFGGNTMSAELFRPTVPTAVAPELNLRSVSVGYEVACGLTDTGATHCWGDNPYGQLGDGTTGLPRMTPEPVVGGRTFQRVVAGYQRACGFTAEGGVYCWGRNDQGQLGDGSVLNRSEPMAVIMP